MSQAIRDALTVAVLILGAAAAAVYVSERVNLANAYAAGMAEFYEVYRAVMR